MIGQVVMDSASREVDASQTLAIEKYVFGFQIAREIGFGDDSRSAIPIQGAGCATRFLDSISICIVDVGNASGALNAVLRVIHILPRSRVIGEISRSVITEPCCLIIDVACM